MSDAGTSSSVVVDDWSDYRGLRYVGDWNHLYKVNGALNNTITYTTKNGSSIIFTFNGTAVVVAGTIVPVNGREAPISLYTVDGSTPVNYITPDNVTNEMTDVPFFITNSLSPGVHELVINVTRTQGYAPFLLDYIAYLPPQATQSSDTISLSPSTHMPSFTGVPTSSSSSTPVGAIVGGVVGGVAVLAFAAVALLLLCRRRSQNRPYFYQSANATDMLHQETKRSPTVTVNPLHTPMPVPAPPSVIHTPSIQSEPNGGPLAQVPSHVSQATPAQAIYHADSGVRFTRTGEPVHTAVPAFAPSTIPDDAPPEYTEH